MLLEALRYGIENLVHDDWTCTIIPARYGGAYEPGKWLAFPLSAEAIARWAPAVHGGDLECATFWRDEHVLALVGAGDTPSAALDDLREKAKVTRG